MAEVVRNSRNKIPGVYLLAHPCTYVWPKFIKTIHFLTIEIFSFQENAPSTRALFPQTRRMILSHRVARRNLPFLGVISCLVAFALLRNAVHTENEGEDEDEDVLIVGIDRA